MPAVAPATPSVGADALFFLTVTPADKLPITKITRPLGFDPKVWVPGSLDIHELRQGDKGTIFASSAYVAVAGQDLRSGRHGR